MKGWVVCKFRRNGVSPGRDFPLTIQVVEMFSVKTFAQYNYTMRARDLSGL